MVLMRVERKVQMSAYDKKKNTWQDLVTKRKGRHYRLKVCVPPKFICWSSNSQSDGIWRWGSLEVNWVRREMELVVKNLTANAGDTEMWIWSMGQEDLLEKEMATHSSILAWENPMDRQARVHGVAKIWIRLKWLSTRPYNKKAFPLCLSVSLSHCTHKEVMWTHSKMVGSHL